MLTSSAIRIEIEQMCVELGSNPLLVQGAGGNVSWKENDTLWIKASGTWLADAGDEDIFIPTNLVHIRKALSEDDFSVKPIVTSDSALRPSIETLLHALMPQRVVVHLHAIDVLSHLVRDDCELNFKNILPEDMNYALVKYCKPGEDLAENVYQKIQSNEQINVVFLLNHGLVIGGESVSEVLQLLDNLLDYLKTEIDSEHFSRSFVEDGSATEKLNKHGYVPAEFPTFHALALNSSLSYLVENKWALFPDHVVFLGEKALIGDCDVLNTMLMGRDNSCPAFIFCKDIGTFQHISVTRAQIDQLACFYDVAIRQSDFSKIVKLSDEDINELLGWDAEKYRLSIAKS
jgi:rhamnose utilization protein RhaD (predicted bifunctional aldolase and dehydrogenase)